MNILIENAILLNHGGSVTFKPFFHDIGKYVYVHNDYTTTNRKVDVLFNRFKSHPLLLWKLEVTCGSNTHVLELITNITHSGRGFGVFTVGDVHYVNDPCMVYRNNEFLDNFNKNYSSNNFFNLDSSHVDIYRSHLTSKLNSGVFNHGIFYQRDLSGSVSYGVQIDLLGPKT